MTALTVIAPIKLNLNLHVIGVNQKQYHLLEGVSVFANEGDIIHITLSHSECDYLYIEGQFSEFLQHEDVHNNLIIKAIKSLRAIQIFPFLTVTLEKNIPIQAGYGGGSSDAAAILKAINRLFCLELSFDELLKIGQSLGSDVPMCLYAKPCLVQNIGDHITPLVIAHKTYLCLLLKPNFMLSTPQVFQALSNKNNPTMPKTDDLVEYAIQYGRNDLWQAALMIRPELKHYLEVLKLTHPIKASMSGSGSGLFALYDNQKSLDNAYDFVRNIFQDNFIIKTTINL